MNVLYSTGCAKCTVLKKKLDQLGIPYRVNRSVEEMQALGFTEAPVLSVDGQLFNFNSAIKWLKEEEAMS